MAPIDNSPCQQTREWECAIHQWSCGDLRLDRKDLAMEYPLGKLAVSAKP